jgi:hypothetical protein
VLNITELPFDLDHIHRMHEIESGTYFRRLAVRCLTASRDSYELRAKEEFRKLAEEFAAKADELERVRYPSCPKTGCGDG